MSQVSLWLQLTKIWEWAPLEVEIKLVPGGAVWRLRATFVSGALQTGSLGWVCHGVGERVLSVDRTMHPGDGAASVEGSGLVQHHLLGGFGIVLQVGIGNLVQCWTSCPGQVFRRVAGVEASDGRSVELKHVRWSRLHPEAPVAGVTLLFVSLFEYHVVPYPPVALSPGANRVEQDWQAGVGDLPRGQRLRQELSLELQRKVAAGGCWN